MLRDLLTMHSIQFKCGLRFICGIVWMFLQRRDNPSSWTYRKKKMTSPRRGKRKLPVEEPEDWEERRENEEDEDEDEEEEDYDWTKPIIVEDGRDYARARGKQPQRDDLSPRKDSSAAKLALEIEKKELLIMKRELALTSRRHSVREHSSDEEEDGAGEKWVAMRRTSNRNSQMKAKRRAANKACRDEFEERAREGKPRFVVDLDDNGKP